MNLYKDCQIKDYADVYIEKGTTAAVIIYDDNAEML